MRNLHRFAAVVLPIQLAVGLSACGGGDAAQEEQFVEETQVAEPATPIEETPATQETFVLTPADLALYERGMRAGVARLEQAAEEKRAARSGTDTLQAMAVVVGNTLDEHMARAAGVPIERFGAIRGAVDEVLGKLQMGGMHAQMREQMDTTNVPPEQREAMRENLRQMEAAWGDPYAGLTPETAEALRARADELARLRAELLGATMRLAQ